MKILYVTATEAEAAALKKAARNIRASGSFTLGSLDIHLLVGGIGSVSTIYRMSKWISENGMPDLAVNGGIAGNFSENCQTGDVVIPVTECFADLGIDDKDNFQTLWEAELTDANEYPFVDGLIHGDEEMISRFNSIKRVKSITVNTATGSAASIEKLKRKYNPDIETMEGASFFYLCKCERIPFLALRAISNRVEPRNRSNWNIKLALDNLSERLRDVFLTFD